MINKIYILLFSFSCLILHSQETDLSKKFKTNDWKTELNWFNSDTLILKTIKKKDTTWNSLTLNEKKNKINQIWIERISFDSNGNLNYKNNTYCGNSDYRKLNNIEFIDNKIIADFTYRPYNATKDITLKKWFEIINWTDERILLIKTD
ncbi:hypothetical protein Q4Q35_08720 [Flavivirga aquimarina]|uniref:Lipocalin-like domain-containing protein n=1 Tax=Flavivirga aquimarina TaxID=2027862 RepID=A0ABT8W9T6_9FLAO|nr:hypothetical protein [Flavivirga aquimarina]MDO5969890.1 hypothetical protein [Flavivirga aquimarina]